MDRPSVPIADRPSYRPRFSRIIIDAEGNHAVVDGHVFELIALSKTTWRIVDLQTGEASWFRLGPNADEGSWFVQAAENETAASVGAAWVWSCRQLVKSPLPPRPSLH